MSRVSFEHFGGKERRMMWGRKDEEYAADFHLIAKRRLDPFHYRVFSYHYLLGADWKLCCRRLGIDRGRFFHAVYRVQESLGRVFYELEPYGLYPPRDYFATQIGGPSRLRGGASQAATRKPLFSRSGNEQSTPEESAVKSGQERDRARAETGSAAATHSEQTPWPTVVAAFSFGG